MHPRTLLALAVFIAPLASAAEMEFEGMPSVKVEVSEGAAQAQPVPPQRAREFGVKVMQQRQRLCMGQSRQRPAHQARLRCVCHVRRNHWRWLCQSVEPNHAKGASSTTSGTAREGVRLHGAHGQSVGVNYVLRKVTSNPSIERTPNGGRWAFGNVRPMPDHCRRRRSPEAQQGRRAYREARPSLGNWTGRGR